MARFQEGVALRVKHDPKAIKRQIAIHVYTAARNRSNGIPASMITMVPGECADLIADLAEVLALTDKAAAVTALTVAADRIAPKPLPIPGKQ